MSKYGAFTERWMLLDHSNLTAQHHLNCFFSHSPAPRTTAPYFKDNKSPGLRLIRPKDTLEYYSNQPTFILCNSSLLNACCFWRDWYFTFILISCRSISALWSSTYRTLWTIITEITTLAVTCMVSLIRTCCLAIGVQSSNTAFPATVPENTGYCHCPVTEVSRQCHWRPISEMQQISLLFYW